VPNHDTSLIPLETWCFASPGLRASGQVVDLGLLAESLLYYDKVYFNVGTPSQFASLLQRLIRSDSLDDFLAMVENGEVWAYDYSFVSAPVQIEREFAFVNIQDPVQAAYGTWPRRFLYHRDIDDVIPHARRRQKIYRAFRDRVIEAKADDFGPAVTNARQDAADPRRNKILLQSFIDELYAIKGLGRAPAVDATVRTKPDNSGHVVTWNVDFQELTRLAGPELGFHNGTPFAAAAVCNRLLHSAAQRRWDLFLPQPMAALVGDKLYETVKTPVRSTLNIERLKAEVEFPDIRALVNSNELSFRQVLELRARAKKFRQWLQMEADRDRNAIVAYHNEVSRTSGFSGVAPRALHLFGVVGGGAVGGAIGGSVAGPIGGAVGGAAGAGVGYVADLGASVIGGWKPVVFGRWLESRIEAYVSQNAFRRDD
jgi:hypothetical protein